MKTLKCLIVAALLCTQSFLNAQTINSYYQTVVSNVSYDTLYSNLQTFQNFGRKSFSNNDQALKTAGQWLYTKYLSLGYADVRRDSFTNSGHPFFNVVTTKNGTLYPNKYVIVTCHYDSQTGPGTNDNGSGVSTILEIARVMSAIPTEYSVKFICFTGEEAGFVGSQNYVNNIVIPANMDIRLVFNIDEVGGIAGQTNNTIRCEKDNGNPSTNNTISSHFTDTLTTLTGLYSSLSTVITDAYGSDYMPFEENGEYITGYYEDNESQVVHSTSDILTNMDPAYVYQIAKAATGATLYFAKAYDVLTSVNIQQLTDPEFSIFPNPVSNNLFIYSANDAIMQITDITGRMVYQSKINQNEKRIVNTLDFKKGIYVYHIYGTSGSLIKTGKIIKS
jgi:aminopeptidase YwaD